VPKEHRFQALELALCATLACWWGTHKDSLAEWREYKRMMKLSFRYANTFLTEKYSAKDDLHDHLAQWTKAWGESPQPEWVPIFCHTLDTISMNWYMEMELCHGTAAWDILREIFVENETR